MGYRFDRSDIGYLTGATGTAALAEVARLKLSPATRLRDVAHIRHDHGERTAALVETVGLRRRAARKLERAHHWLFTDDALQQATPTAVARHRARRLSGYAVHDVTCSIGAEVAELAGTCPAVIGSDLDPIRLAMARHNLAVEPSDRARGEVLLVRGDALRPCSTGTVIVADPGRRADGKRTHDPAKLQPPLPDLLGAYPGRSLVVKCAPGLDFDRLGWPGEVEIVSLNGAVREACLWSAELAEPGVARRAVLLTADGAITYTDAMSADIPEREPGEWIVDPDGAVIRAGLVRQYAAAHGLWQLDPRIAYLTGDRPPPGHRAFRVLDQYPFREKALRSELRRRDCGPLEILVRGVDLDPDRLRRRLKPTGSVPYTVVVTRIGSTATVFLCTAERSAPGG